MGWKPSHLHLHCLHIRTPLGGWRIWPPNFIGRISGACSKLPPGKLILLPIDLHPKNTAPGVNFPGCGEQVLHEPGPLGIRQCKLLLDLVIEPRAWAAIISYFGGPSSGEAGGMRQSPRAWHMSHKCFIFGMAHSLNSSGGRALFFSTEFLLPISRLTLTTWRHMAAAQFIAAMYCAGTAV